MSLVYYFSYDDDDDDDGEELGIFIFVLWVL